MMTFVPKDGPAVKEHFLSAGQRGAALAVESKA
jgi:hypothetical protein